MGTQIVEGKNLFPKARKSGELPDATLVIDRIFALAADSGVQISVAVLRIDDAWILRNECGKTGLGKALKTLVELLQDRTPDELLYDRWGAAGFICLLPGASLAEMMSTLRKLLDTLRAKLSHLFPNRQVTFSAGVACWPQHGTTRTEVLSRAEETLHTAQRLGKACLQPAADRNEKEITVNLSAIQCDRLAEMARVNGVEFAELVREILSE